MPLSELFNMSIKTGEFPTKMKLAKVLPIYKSGSHDLLENYRPISILSVFSKIFERMMFNRMWRFIEKFKIINDRQFGFKPKSSTELAISVLYDSLLRTFDQKQYTLGVFIDLKKAFDVIDHRILLVKLEHYGFRGVVLQWFKSYLMNRKQYVTLDGFRSLDLEIETGVPQGSILGPLLFILFINDIFSVSNLCSMVLFADDTNIFMPGNDPTELFKKMNNELINFNKWFTNNKLALNLQKSCYIVFGPKIKTNLKILNDLNICIGNSIIPRVDSTKFLGLIIQSDLKWHLHIEMILNKLYKTVGIIRKARNKLTSEIVLLLYYSFFYPFLIYGNIFWGATNKTLIYKLTVIQKRFIRICFSLNYMDHTKIFFQNNQILNIEQINKFITLCFIYKVLNFENYRSLDRFDRVGHGRYFGYLRAEKSRTVVNDKSWSVRGLYLWNELGINNCSVTFMNFKKMVKTLLLKPIE